MFTVTGENEMLAWGTVATSWPPDGAMVPHTEAEAPVAVPLPLRSMVPLVSSLVNVNRNGPGATVGQGADPPVAGAAPTGAVTAAPVASTARAATAPARRARRRRGRWTDMQDLLDRCEG